MWEELWKSPEIQWLPLKYFLTHHLEFDYEVNRFEFAPVMLFFFSSPTGFKCHQNMSQCSFLTIMINVVRRRNVTKSIPNIFLTKKTQQPQPHTELYFRWETVLGGRQKTNHSLPYWGSDRDLQGLGNLAISVDFRPDKGRLLEEKKNTRMWLSECLLAMVQWNIWQGLTYLVFITNVTQENSHTVVKDTFKNMLDTENKLKLLFFFFFFLGEGIASYF